MHEGDALQGCWVLQLYIIKTCTTYHASSQGNHTTLQLTATATATKNYPPNMHTPHHTTHAYTRQLNLRPLSVYCSFRPFVRSGLLPGLLTGLLPGRLGTKTDL